MNRCTQLVVFRLDAHDYALPLPTVERIFRAVEVTRLPGAPACVIGAVDVHGCVLPVLNLRYRFGLPDRAINPADHMLIASTTERRVALVIDEARGVVERDDTCIIPLQPLSPGLEKFQGLIQLDGDLVLIQDLERFFSLDEQRALDAALSALS